MINIKLINSKTDKIVKTFKFSHSNEKSLKNIYIYATKNKLSIFLYSEEKFLLKREFINDKLSILDNNDDSYVLLRDGRVVHMKNITSNLMKLEVEGYLSNEIKPPKDLFDNRY